MGEGEKGVSEMVGDEPARRCKTSEFSVGKNVAQYVNSREQTRTYSFLFLCLLVDWEMSAGSLALKQEEQQHCLC